MTGRFVLAGALVAGLTLAAQAPPTPRFRHERAIQVSTDGPHRLDVDVPLLAGAKPFSVVARNQRFMATTGLADLRFFDSAGKEVPYLLIDPPPGDPVWREARVLPVAQTEKTSGFEADLGDASAVDAIRISGIRAPFLKRLVLEGSGDRQRWTLLDREGTFFDLPREQLEQLTLEFAPGPYRYLRVTWDDTNSGRVEPPSAVGARRVAQFFAPAPALRAPLSVEKRPSEPGISRFRLTLPAGRLPIVAIELTVGGGHLLREAMVTEAKLTRDQAIPTAIGQATLRRVIRDGVAANALRIPITPPDEAQLDLVVDDGNNPPLELQSATAIFAELPWIYFDHPSGTITARYGDPKLEAPRYDLEAARAGVSIENVKSALWGDATVTASVRDEAGLPMPDVGAPLEAGRFKYSRSIPAGSGLTTVPLDAAVLAHSGSIDHNFADVRVLDGAGRQVPYLLERRDEPIAVDVKVEKRELPESVRNQHPGRSSYILQLPYERLPGARIALHTRARVFSRGVTMAMLLPADARRREPQLEGISQSTWQHSVAEVPAPALLFSVPETRTGDLFLVVDEGDNQPLPIENATLLLPSYALRLYRHGDSPLRLAYGRDDLGAPRYDMALLAPRVFGSVAAEAYAEREQTAATELTTATIVSPPVFWASLGLAVVVLLGLIVRLVRKDEGTVSP